MNRLTPAIVLCYTVDVLQARTSHPREKRKTKPIDKLTQRISPVVGGYANLSDSPVGPGEEHSMTVDKWAFLFLRPDGERGVETTPPPDQMHRRVQMATQTLPNPTQGDKPNLSITEQYDAMDAEFMAVLDQIRQIRDSATRLSYWLDLQHSLTPLMVATKRANIAAVGVQVTALLASQDGAK